MGALGGRFVDGGFRTMASMMNQSQSNAPFGLQPNIAAGLAYLLGIVGGIAMLVGGGTNKTVKWAAAQSIVMWGIYIVLLFVIPTIAALTHVAALGFLGLIVGLVWFALWAWTSIMAFTGKDVRVPAIAGVTESIFKTAAL
jgi:uncharacterized membrane protein